LPLPDGRVLDLRVSSLPTLFGEKLVIRILSPDAAAWSLDQLGYEAEDKERMMQAIQRPHGMVLVTGPTGSGKTQSLYACLNVLNTPEVNIAKHPDLLIGVVPVINLEWIQKLWRDKSKRGYSTEAVTDTILRRMPDYVNYICPQFAHTHVNFQRVPCVDTSNPFIAREIPAPDESFVVIRFANPKGIDFPYLLNMIHDSFMSRANTVVVPGGKMELAMQLIFTPFVWRMMERKKKA
jgi:energy-coupling factor transporter ATP-binding protein EcfA2